MRFTSDGIPTLPMCRVKPLSPTGGDNGCWCQVLSAPPTIRPCELATGASATPQFGSWLRNPAAWGFRCSPNRSVTELLPAGFPAPRALCCLPGDGSAELGHFAKKLPFLTVFPTLAFSISPHVARAAIKEVTAQASSCVLHSGK